MPLPSAVAALPHRKGLLKVMRPRRERRFLPIGKGVMGTNPIGACFLGGIM
jgi:hypothetical protein